LGPMSETCPRCGMDIDQGQAACPDCGLPIDPAAICNSCETRVRKDDEFCWSCGKRLEHQLYCWHCGSSVWTQSLYCAACGAQQPDLAKLLQQLTREERTQLPFSDRRDNTRPAEETLVRQTRPTLTVSTVPETATRPPARSRRTMQVEPLGAAAADSLKIVTVLFADVSGFTHMSESMHPEQVKDVLDDCFAGLTTAITNHGGIIDKYIGDCVMALFGAKLAHENDPERALDAAIAMQVFLEGYSADLLARTGLTLAMRIGINTGTVLAGFVGRGDSQDFTVMGDAVNLASRLESACPVGSILVSYETFRLVQGLFEVKQLEPIQVKGKSEPVRVVEVLGRRAGGMTIEVPDFRGVPTRMIGRQKELDQLKAGFIKASKHNTPVPVTVRSSIGMGKSRLIYEFVSWLISQAQHDLDFMRCRDYRTETTFAPLIDLVVRLVGAETGDDPAALKLKTAAYLDELELDDSDRARVEASILNLLGIETSRIPILLPFANDPEQLKSAIREGILTLYRTRAAKRPMILAVEDLHMASDPFLDLLATLASCENLPILIIMSFRPEADQRVEDRFEFHEERVHCVLEPLGDIDSNEMINDLLQRIENIPDELITRVMNVSEGRPLFIEEILSDLVERDIIICGDESWEIKLSKAKDVTLPQSIESAILSRVDALPEPCREALQIASVVGDVCWDTLIKDFGIPETRSVLNILEERQFIRFRRITQILKTKEFVFLLPAVRETLEHHVLRKVKVRWHDAIAEWIEARVKGEHEYFDRLKGHHHFEAGNVTNALPYRLRSGNKAEERGDINRALDDLQWIWRHSRRDDGSLLLDSAELSESRVSVARLLRRVGRPTEAEEAFTETKDVFAAQAEKFSEVDLALRRTALETAHALIQAGQHETANTLLELAIADLDPDKREAGWLQLAARTSKWQGWIAYLQKQHEAALDFYNKGISLASTLGPSTALGSLHDGKGVCLSRLERFSEAEKSFNRALEIFGGAGHREGQAGSQGNLGVLRYRQGKLDEALEHINKARHLYLAIGDTVIAAVCRSNTGDVLFEQGKFGSARKEFEDALVTFKRTRSQDYRSAALQSLIACLKKLGDSQEERKRTLELEELSNA